MTVILEAIALVMLGAAVALIALSGFAAGSFALGARRRRSPVDAPLEERLTRDVTLLRLEEGDSLVMHCENHLNHNQVERIRDQIERFAKLTGRRLPVLVVDGGNRLSVLRAPATTSGEELLRLAQRSARRGPPENTGDVAR